MMTGWDFILNNQDFHDDRLRFYYERLIFSSWEFEILLWMVEIFMMTGRDFHDNRPRFFSSWGCLVSTVFSAVYFLTQLNTIFFFHFFFFFLIIILKMHSLCLRWYFFIIIITIKLLLINKYIKSSYLGTNKYQIQIKTFNRLSSILILLCQKQTHSPKTNLKDWFYLILTLYRSINCICTWDQTICLFLL